MQILGSLTHKGLAGMYTIRMDVYVFMLSRAEVVVPFFLLSPLHTHMRNEKLFPVNAQCKCGGGRDLNCGVQTIRGSLAAQIH